MSYAVQADGVQGSRSRAVNVKKIWPVLKYVVFFVCFMWLLFFVLMTSVHEYEWMLNDPVSKVDSWCWLPLEKDSIRREMYIIFLFQFVVMSLVFIRIKNLLFSVLMFLLFCYATYALIVRDMLCAT